MVAAEEVILAEVAVLVMVAPAVVAVDLAGAAPREEIPVAEALVVGAQERRL